MAKKKNQSKKHRFKYAGESAAAPEMSGAVTAAGATVSASGTTAAGVAAARTAIAGRRAMASTAAATRDFSYVSRDVRRIAVLAVALVALEAVLWYLLGSTGLGNVVYNLVKV